MPAKTGEYFLATESTILGDALAMGNTMSLKMSASTQPLVTGTLVLLMTPLWFKLGGKTLLTTTLALSVRNLAFL
jgi:hypothetical protein